MTERSQRDQETSGRLNLARHVYRRGLESPDLVSIACEGEELTYRDLSRRAGKLAAVLRARLNLAGGGSPKPLIGVIASRSIDACVAALGSAWAGATYVPIGTKTPEDRLRKIAQACGFAAFVTDAQGAKLLSPAVLAEVAPPLIVVPRSEPYRELAARCGKLVLDTRSLEDEREPPLADFEPDDLAYVMFTSGTTGVPKGVMISAGSANGFLDMIGERLCLDEHDRTLEVTELGFDVSVMNMFGTWEAGASLHVLPAARVMNAVAFARDSRLTVWNSTPSLIALLRQIKQLSPDSLPDVRLAIFIGEPLSRSAVAAFRAAAPGCVVENLYGPTEATVVCTGQRAESDYVLTPNRDVLSIGTPLPGNEAVVMNDRHEILPPGQIGELVLSGPQLAQGYLGAPDLTSAKFPVIDGKRWYLTGDSAFCGSDGLLHHLGRIDNQVKVLGNRVELEEIEAHLRDITQLELVAVVPWPTVDGMHHGLIAFVCGAERASVIPALQRRVPAYMLPSKIHWLEQMPINQNGKIDRRALTRKLESEKI